MSAKVIDMRDGDIYHGYGCMMWQGRNGLHRTIGFRDIGPWQGMGDALSTDRRMNDDEAMQYIRGCGMPIDDMRSNPAPLSESRVREIVEEVLAAKAKPTADEIGEAVRIANDPKTVWNEVNPEPDWRGLLEELVKAVDDADRTSLKYEDAWIKVQQSPALASARTNLAAAGKAVGK